MRGKNNKVQNYMEVSRLHLIKFDFVTGGQEIKIATREEF